MTSLTGICTKRVPGEMNRCSSQRPSNASRHAKRRAALDATSKYHVVDDSYEKCNDHDAFNGSVLPEKDTVPAMPESETNSIAGLWQNILPPYSASWISRCSPSQRYDHPTSNCSLMNHRTCDPGQGSDARLFSYSATSRAFSIKDNYFRRECRLPTAWKASHQWKISFLFFICLLQMTLCLVIDKGHYDECSPGLTTAGKTYPHGDIVLKHGEALNISCILNETFVAEFYPGRNSSHIHFLLGSSIVPSDLVTIVNETTALLYIEKLPPSDYLYSCNLETGQKSQPFTVICINKVVVGHPPAKPKSFNCLSYNWENMNCTWKPEHNFIHTTYKLFFRFGKSAYACPTEPELLEDGSYRCIWDETTNPLYRQPYEIYTFILIVENVLARETFTYKVNHYAHVIPKKPDNLSVIQKTSKVITLSWEYPLPLSNFPPGLHERIMYQDQWDRHKSWKVINITSPNRDAKRHYDLTGLKYANSVYDVRVLLKSVTADENMWGDFSDITFRTLPTLPGLPPRTDVGSFEIVENENGRDVYLYWQSIPQNQENGDNFRYNIVYVEQDGKEIKLTPMNVTKTYAVLRISKVSSYRFEILAENSVGVNKERAKLFVPIQKEITPLEPIAFTKIAFDGGLYELSWKPPDANNNITNYTIFWCDHERDRPYQCTGYLDWVHVSPNTTIYNVTVPNPDKVYQFAISANTHRRSSGMVWASCTVIHNQVVGKMKSVWINRIGSDFIEVGWKLDCSDRIGIIDGFKIYYCPIISPYNLNCKESKKNVTIKASPHTIYGVVKDLQPYSTYMLAVSVLTKNGESLHSDPLYNTTLEAAPSTPPQDVRISNVTNTTLYFSWKSPEAMNGVLRYYEVYYNEHKMKVEEDEKIILKDLQPYKNYSLGVTACTVSCSDKSSLIYQVTQIGVPGKIDVPKVRFLNSSQVIVRWSKPEIAAGPLHYYEIMTSNGEVQNSTRSEIQLPIPDCKIASAHKEQNYQFRVRAINIAADGEHLKGPWSDPGEGNCYSEGSSFLIWLMIFGISTVAIVVITLCLMYCLQRAWATCRAMRDVEVKLPPGLAPNMKLLQKVNEQHTRQPSADSSGCSSGQESVTSSLTAHSQVSSDSGTEVNPVSPDKLESLPSWESATCVDSRESNSLRQRNIVRPAEEQWDLYKIGKSDEPILSETLSMARSTPNLTDSTAYTTSQHTWSSTGYISMPSSEEASSNPSPVPRENLCAIAGANTGANPGTDSAGAVAAAAGAPTTATSGYSVVGSVRKPGRSNLENDSGVTRIIRDAFITIKPDAKKVAKPYVTHTALERMSKEKQSVDAFHDLNKLRFVEQPDKRKNPDILTTQLNASPDKMSKSYVQTGLIDTQEKQFLLSPVLDSTNRNPMCNSFALTNFTDSYSKPYVTSFATEPMSTLATCKSLNEPLPLSKPYVAVSSLSEVTRSPSLAARSKEPSSQKPYVQHGPVATNEGSSKPYVLASSVCRMLQQHQENAESCTNVAEEDESWEKINLDDKEPNTAIRIGPLSVNKKYT